MCATSPIKLPKLRVAGSRPVSRSTFPTTYGIAAGFVPMIAHEVPMNSRAPLRVLSDGRLALHRAGSTQEPGRREQWICIRSF